MLGPIFQREWLTLPRRPRHYLTRAAYIGLLWILGVTAWQALYGWAHTPTLGDTSRFGPFLFQIYSFVQLTVLLFFSSLSAAAAISYEKDRRTFILLLLTDLRNYEIVLGKLFGSVLQIGLLLAVTVPVMMMLILLGGISLQQVFQAVLVMAATGVAAGSLGCVVALWRERTFQSLALTVLLLVLYLTLVRGLDAVPQVTRTFDHLGIPWQLWCDPFLALQAVVTAYDGGIIAPAYGYSLFMVLLSGALNCLGIVMLRKWNPSGEPIMQRDAPVDAEAEEKDRAAAHAAPGKARHVWDNPILWREIRTRAYGRRPLLIKFAFFVVATLISYYAIVPIITGQSDEYIAARGLVPVAVLSLLLFSAQAVTAATSERDTGALDLLLVTDLSPWEFVFGKLGGIWYNAKEYLIPPLALALFYAWNSLLAEAPVAHPERENYKNVEAFFCIMGGVLILLAFATVLGLHVALRNYSSRLAIVNTLGTIFFLSVGTLICIYLIRINGQNFGSQLASFVLFLLAGIGGLWWVLNVDRPSTALTIASWLCPLAVLYAVTNILIAKPGSVESTSALTPFTVVAVAFGFTTTAMLVPLVSEFDVALGRTTSGADGE